MSLNLSGDPASKNPTLFILGDSISIQYGSFLEQMLAGRYFCDRKGSELLSAQGAEGGQENILGRLAAMDSSRQEINGGDSCTVLAYLLGKSASKPPTWTVLLLNCGLHDIRIDPEVGARQVDPEIYAENLTKILPLAARLSRFIVWVRTTPVVDTRHQRLNQDYYRFNADVERYNQIADAIMDQLAIPKIDLYRFTYRLSSSFESLDALYSDHVHFVEPVQRLQAAYLAGWLEAYPFA